MRDQPEKGKYQCIVAQSTEFWLYFIFGAAGGPRYEICEFLDTTPNYLFFESEDDEERLSPAERELIRTYRSFDEGRKRYIRIL